MPKGQWKKCFFANDPKISFVKVKTDGRKEPEYYYELAQLIKLIVENITPIVNYAHVNLLIPKYRLPLRFEGQHMDISYLTTSKTLCFIQFHVIPKRRLPKYIRETFL